MLSSMPHGAQRASATPVATGRPAGRTWDATLRQVLARAAIAGGLGLMLLVPAAGVASAHGTNDATEREVLSITIRPGQLVTDHGVSVVAPPRGQSVWGEIHFTDGSAQVLQAETRRDGRVFTRHLGDDRVATIADRRTDLARSVDVRDAGLADGAAAGLDSVSGATTATSACSSGAYYSYSWRMPSYRWYYQVYSTPSSMSRVDTPNAIKRANTNLVTGRNSCGRRDYISATYSFLGNTSRGTNISSTARCTGGDGVSVIGFGYLPSSAVAMACVYGLSGGDAREGDVRLNYRVSWANYRTSCHSATLVESALTHEIGHVYGLGHVYVSGLTMNPYIPNCSLDPATLGLGDMYGLERKY